ncbi:MAG TPA: hypothetical protein VG994_10980 [Steroidobacteraceae bacterium]|nr:hypothetical protein [Steroidobacteraceae bacterium]
MAHDLHELTREPRVTCDLAGWARVMLGAIARNAAYFNSHRTMRRYATETYLG